MSEQLILFSVYQNDTQPNTKNHKETKHFLESSGVTYKEITVKYNNVMKLHFVISSKNEAYAESLSKKFNQNNYFFVDKKRYVYSTKVDTGKCHKIGKMQESKKAIESLNCICYIMDREKFYVVK